jgi:hypothetical protein
MSKQKILPIRSVSSNNRKIKITPLKLDKPTKIASKSNTRLLKRTISPVSYSDEESAQSTQSVNDDDDEDQEDQELDESSEVDSDKSASIKVKNDEDEDDIEIDLDEDLENDSSSSKSDVEEDDSTKSKSKAKTPVKKTKLKVSSTDELDLAMLRSVENDDFDLLAAMPKKSLGARGKLKSSTADVDEDDEPSADEKPKKPRKKAVAKEPGVKKGPGRPRKTPKKEPIPRKGISNKPTNVDDHIEVLYDHPVILKKIFQFFKSLAAAQIQILFRQKDIVFYAEDHHKKSKIYVKIDASKLNHYYCKSELDIGISAKEIELILNKVDKEYSSMVLLSTIGNIHRSITMVLENDMRIDEIHTIDLIGQYSKMENEEDFTNEDYMIKFQFPSKYFRKTINDIKTMSSQLSITQEDSESPLVFEYLTPNKKIQSKHTVKDSAKIKLESNIDDDSSFRVDLKVEFIKPISAAQIADEVCILVDEKKSFMTKAFIDEGTIEIKTLTEIIDDRPEDDD